MKTNPQRALGKATSERNDSPRIPSPFLEVKSRKGLFFSPTRDKKSNPLRLAKYAKAFSPVPRIFSRRSKECGQKKQ